MRSASTIGKRLPLKLLEYYHKGLFPFDKLIKFYPFEEINTAFKESHEGKCIKAVLVMD